MKEINKPITIARADFVSNLSNLINESGLPSFIIEPILKDFTNDMRIISQRQLEKDKKEYEEMLANIKE